MESGDRQDERGTAVSGEAATRSGGELRSVGGAGRDGGPGPNDGRSERVQRIAQRMRAMAHAHDLRRAQAATALGMSQTRVEALRLVAAAPEPLTMGQLAAQQTLPPDDLAAGRGVARRAPCPVDEVLAAPRVAGVRGEPGPDGPPDGPPDVVEEFCAVLRARRFDLGIQLHGGGAGRPHGGRRAGAGTGAARPLGPPACRDLVRI